MITFIRSSSAEAKATSGFEKSERAKRVKSGLLPPPVEIGGKARAFIAHELEAVAVARATGADDNDIRKLVADLVAARSAAKAA